MWTGAVFVGGTFLMKVDVDSRKSLLVWWAAGVCGGRSSVEQGRLLFLAKNCMHFSNQMGLSSCTITSPSPLLLPSPLDSSIIMWPLRPESSGSHSWDAGKELWLSPPFQLKSPAWEQKDGHALWAWAPLWPWAFEATKHNTQPSQRQHWDITLMRTQTQSTGLPSHVLVAFLCVFFTITSFYKSQQFQCTLEHWFCSESPSIAPSLPYLLFQSLCSLLSGAFCRALAAGNVPRLLFPAGACCYVQ